MITRTRIKKWLLLTHRYLGVAGCVLFLIWFLSGFAMMYVEMPYLLRTDSRLDGFESLEASIPLLEPAAALTEAGIEQPPRRLFLTMQDGTPVWRALPQRGPMVTLAADTGNILGPWSPDAALRSAQSWGGWDGDLEYERTVDLDQWTLYSNLFAQHRPLHRFRVDGPRGALVHVSETTGMVVQITTRRERLLAWIGPIVHWIYPTIVRKHGNLWTNLVVSLSALGVVLVVAGTVLGFWNLRRSSSKNGISPYTQRWMRWHHLFGVSFSVVTLSWIFSGMMSMNPLEWAPDTGATAQEVAWLAGGELDWSAFHVGADDALASFAGLEVKELEARFFAGRPYWVAWETPKRSLVLAADVADAVPSAEFPGSMLRSTTAGLVPGASLIEWTRLEDYDNYYYSKKSFRYRKRLPIYRARFDDSQKTSYYIDPHSGAVVQRMEPLSRLSRYLYQGLHSWDILGFFNRRPWWDLILGFFMIGGAFGALTSVAIGLKWSQRWWSRRRRTGKAGSHG